MRIETVSKRNMEIINMKSTTQQQAEAAMKRLREAINRSAGQHKRAMKNWKPS